MAYTKATVHYLLLTFNVIAVCIFIAYNFERISRHDDQCIDLGLYKGDEHLKCYSTSFDDAQCNAGYDAVPSLDCEFDENRQLIGCFFYCFENKGPDSDYIPVVNFNMPWGEYTEPRVFIIIAIYLLYLICLFLNMAYTFMAISDSVREIASTLNVQFFYQLQPVLVMVLFYTFAMAVVSNFFGAIVPYDDENYVQLKQNNMLKLWLVQFRNFFGDF